MKGIIRKGMLAFAATALASLGLVTAASANPSNITERTIVSELCPSVNFKHVDTVQKVKVVIPDVQNLQYSRGTDEPNPVGTGIIKPGYSGENGKVVFGFDDTYFVKRLASADKILGVETDQAFRIDSAQIGDQDRLGKDLRRAGFYTFDIGSGYPHPMRC